MEKNLGKQHYEKKTNILSRASAKKYNNPFPIETVDYIDWDSPEYAIIPDDDRWILGPEDNLGEHPWYQSLSRERQIEVGKFRFAHTCKVGSQFEQALIAGIMFSGMELRNDNSKFRYSMHEATEETHHIQMFQEFVNRSGVDTKGAAKWFRRVVPFLTPLSSRLPVAFWAVILAGEEPIDQAQHEILDKHENLHPLIEKIMQVHVAEEARHISFAKNQIQEFVPKLSPVQKAAFAVGLPIILRVLADVIMKPSKEELKSAGIPLDVAKEIWWDSENGRRVLHELFPDSRKLADDLGLRGRLGKAAWRAMGIEGPAK